ncbi:MAP3K3, partial [Symbiodinium pilosum]
AWQLPQLLSGSLAAGPKDRDRGLRGLSSLAMVTVRTPWSCPNRSWSSGSDPAGYDGSGGQRRSPEA